MKKAAIKLNIYKFQGKWYWSIDHRDGHNVANGTEGYKRKSDCKRAMLRLLMAISKDKFEIADDWYEKEQ